MTIIAQYIKNMYITNDWDHYIIQLSLDSGWVYSSWVWFRGTGWSKLLVYRHVTLNCQFERRLHGFVLTQLAILGMKGQLFQFGGLKMLWKSKYVSNMWTLSKYSSGTYIQIAIQWQMTVYCFDIQLLLPNLNEHFDELYSTCGPMVHTMKRQDIQTTEHFIYRLYQGIDV